MLLLSYVACDGDDSDGDGDDSEMVRYINDDSDKFIQVMTVRRRIVVRKMEVR